MWRACTCANCACAWARCACACAWARCACACACPSTCVPVTLCHSLKSRPSRAQSSLSSSLTGIDFLGFFAGGTRDLPPTGVGERGVGPMPRGGTGVAARAEAVASGATAHRVVEVGEVPWVLLVAASPVAADAQLRRWRHAGMSCGMYAHRPSRGPKHLLAPSQASQGMHMLRV